jgi:hypothetical protein
MIDVLRLPLPKETLQVNALWKLVIRKKCARPLTSDREIIRVFLTLCSE